MQRIQYDRKQHIHNACNKAREHNNRDFMRMLQRYQTYTIIRKAFAARGYQVPEIVNIVNQYWWGPSHIPYWRIVEQPPDTYPCLQRHPFQKSSH